MSAQLDDVANRQIGEADLPALRAVITTRDRQLVATDGERWRFKSHAQGGTAFVLDWRAESIAPPGWSLLTRDVDIWKHYLASLLVRCATQTVTNAWRAIQSFVGHFTTLHGAVGVFHWRDVTEADMLSFLSRDMHYASLRGNHFAIVRAFYRWATWVAALPDFDPAICMALELVRAEGNVKGASVRSHDPEDGPLDADEQQLVIDGVRAGRGRARDRALVMLHMELGINPQATILLEANDLAHYDAIVTDPHGIPAPRVEHDLGVPRIKKRREQREVRRRPISSELAELLASPEVHSPSGKLIHWCAAQSDIRRALSRWVEECQIVSPRTRMPLVLTPRRLRYTLATEMAREGASRAQIADVLDHSDLQNVEVYIEASSYIVDQIAARLDPIIDPYLQRFKGKIVSRDATNAFPGLPRRIIPGAAPQIPELPLDLGGVGVCGKDVRRDGLCTLAPPLTCYLCPLFAAFRDAPHQQIADALEKIVSATLTDNADARIPLQLSAALQAVRQLQSQIATERILEEPA